MVRWAGLAQASARPLSA